MFSHLFGCVGQQEASLQRSAEVMSGEQVIDVGTQVGALLSEYRKFSQTLVKKLKADRAHSNDMKSAELEMSAAELAEQRRRESAIGHVS